MTEIEIITSVINTLSRNAKCKNRYVSELDNFQNRKIQASNNKYRLGVIGVTSSGKSTMINSLLGEFLLPAAARPSSSQLVSCYHSKVRCAQVFFQNGKSKMFSGSSLSLKQIELYGDEGVNSKNKEKVKQIELSTPDFPFDDSIILIDSPGLDAYGYAGHEQLTMNSLLPTIDFCIFVTTCKTNSDDKMLGLLNTIAEYEKPVIIVQNMIDSLKPSHDGKKSISDVAQDHRVRIERIVNHSKIKDKSKVHIVQISAIYALEARQNKLRSKADLILLEKSNYKTLVSVVETAFNQVRPIVEGHRMKFLKKEIQRIAKAAMEDGSGAQKPIPKFQYEETTREYENKKKACIEMLEKELEKILSSQSTISGKYSFNESDINEIKNRVNSCEIFICNQMKSLNESIMKICLELNIDSRNILTDFRFSKTELYLKTKRILVREGYQKEGEKHMTLKFWKWDGFGYYREPGEWVPPEYENVTDVESTIQNAIKYIKNSVQVFRQTIERWQKSLEITESKLFSEIENRKSEYIARKNKALDCQAYLQIGKDLQRLSDSIVILNENTTNINATKTDVKESQTFPIQVGKELLPMYKLSDNIRLKIHTDTIRYFVQGDSNNIIIGWDENCESKFLLYSFGMSFYASNIVRGNNIVGNSIILVHKPKDKISCLSISNKNVFILVNATQYGSALNEIVELKLSTMLNRIDNLYFVIQDFNETMNGNSVSETLDNIVEIKKKTELNLSCKCNYLLLHDNPIYNLAAVEAQAMGCSTQYDEIRILNDLQKKFRYLLPQDKYMRNITETTIRIIIQKFGRI